MNEDFTGKKLGQYEVVAEVGRGGMATVYKARQGSINRTVAIKVLPRNLLHDPDFYERFEREVDVIAHLEHPHILPIYDYGRSEGVPYIVMRYLGGGSLQDMIRKSTVALEDIEKPITQVAAALDHAHQHGIIHRDLKPANILLDENGNAYLTDFGIARVLGSDLTGSMLIGTPAYMSPEQASGLPLDARSDIYALGVVLFELITGREPYQAETPVALLFKHINEAIPPISTYRQGVPPAVEAVVIRATAKRPDDRYASAGELAQALRNALQTGAPQQAFASSKDTIHEIDTTQLPTRDTPAEIAAPLIDTPAPASRGISPLVMVAAALLVLVVGAGAVFIILNNQQPADTGPDYAATYQAQAALPPTPFPNSQRVQGDHYSISIPQGQGWGGPATEQDGTRTYSTWQTADNNATVTLALQEAALGADSAFADAINAYLERHYQTDDRLTAIDSATAPDGSVRHSFRLHDPDSDPLASGQVDVFFLNRAPYLAVLQMYASDDADNTIVQTFQHILDSLRITP